MAINPNIILSGNQQANVPLINPLEMAMKAQQIKDSQQRGRVADYAMEKENRLASLVKASYDPQTGQLDPHKLKSNLGQAGMYEQINDLNKQEIDIGKEARMGQKDSIENKIKTVEYLTNQARAVKDQSGLDSLRAEAESMVPGAGAKLPAQYSPEGMKSVIDTAMTSYQQMQMQFNKETDQRDFGYKVEKDNQQMAFNQQKELTDEQWRRANFDQRNVAIEATRINKPMTEGQGKANLFSQRASAADEIMNGIGDKINVIGLTAASAIPGGNFLMSEDQQKISQAQRDFVNSILRTESGAVISDQEFSNAQKQYFPQPGDGPEVIKQKGQNRKLAIKGLSEMAGPNAPTNQGEAQGQQQSVRTQTNKKTGQRRQSTDGGLTWQVIN